MAYMIFVKPKEFIQLTQTKYISEYGAHCFGINIFSAYLLFAFIMLITPLGAF